MTRLHLIALAALSLLTACSGANDLGTGKTGKSITVSEVSYDKVWNAALAAVNETKGDQKLEVEKSLHVTKQDKAKGRIEAESGMSALSWGEVVGIFISPAHDAPQHRIEVESLTKMKTNLFANNWEDELLTSIQNSLATAAKK
jgi:hypothetical protein